MKRPIMTKTLETRSNRIKLIPSRKSGMINKCLSKEIEVNRSKEETYNIDE